MKNEVIKKVLEGKDVRSALLDDNKEEIKNSPKKLIKEKQDYEAMIKDLSPDQMRERIKLALKIFDEWEEGSKFIDSPDICCTEMFNALQGAAEEELPLE